MYVCAPVCWMQVTEEIKALSEANKESFAAVGLSSKDGTFAVEEGVDSDVGLDTLQGSWDTAKDEAEAKAEAETKTETKTEPEPAKDNVTKTSWAELEVRQIIYCLLQLHTTLPVVKRALSSEKKIN